MNLLKSLSNMKTGVRKPGSDESFENRGQMKVSAKAEETCLVSNSLTAERAIDTVIEIDKS